MAISVGGVGGYSVYQAQPMNYSLSNKAEVSDVYNKHKAVGDISTVAPVVYPNAQEVKVGEVASTDGQEESRKVNSLSNSAILLNLFAITRITDRLNSSCRSVYLYRIFSICSSVSINCIDYPHS